jgi:hypothetical protein
MVNIQKENHGNVVMLRIITKLATHYSRTRLYINDTNQTLEYLDMFIIGIKNQN